MGCGPSCQTTATRSNGHSSKHPPNPWAPPKNVKHHKKSKAEKSSVLVSKTADKEGDGTPAEALSNAVETTPASLDEKHKAVFVLGGPGAGKGTQCAKISQQFGWTHLSAGDLLRAEQATDSKDSRLIKEYIKNGKIVPADVTIRLLLKAMESSAETKFLIDGFPRSMDNLQGWKEQVGDQVEVPFCLNFECSMEELERRLLKRGEISGRADDNMESIKKRFVAFKEVTVPVLNYFKDRNKLKTVSSAQDVESVWADTKSVFQAYEDAAKTKALVIAGPSGVGKGTLIEKLQREFPASFGFSVSHTTRGPRPGEEDGVHYHFSTRELMQAEIDEGKFVEHNEVHGNLYGTSKQAVRSVSSEGKMCILDIDVQGVRAVRSEGLPALCCFISPPSMASLEARLRGRGTETEDKILKRLGNAQREMDAKDEDGLFDHVVVNDDVDAAYAQLRRIVLPELRAMGVVDAGMQRAFTFVKPHANTEAVRGLVRSKMAEAGASIVAEGEIGGTDIEARQLIDQHYYSIASKATLLKPADLNVPADKFKAAFGEEWATVLADDRAFNAVDAMAATGWSVDELAAHWNRAKDDGKVVKFGGGFYCGRVDADKKLYTFNAFFLPMRQTFTARAASIHYFDVEFDPASLPWAVFRGTVLGPTDPHSAPEGSLRNAILHDWEALGLTAPPDTTYNGVHASASPLEGLAERVNWLGVELKADVFGQRLLGEGLGEDTVRAWLRDPQVVVPDGEGVASLFDQLQDTDVEDCVAKCMEIAAAAAGR